MNKISMVQLLDKINNWQELGFTETYIVEATKAYITGEFIEQNKKEIIEAVNKSLTYVDRIDWDTGITTSRGQQYYSEVYGN